MKTIKLPLAVLALTVALASDALAQFSIGADVVSRYVWRGRDFGNNLSLQPSLAFAAPLGPGTFKIGAWGNFAVSTNDANENDLYATYAVGKVTFIVTDYFFPSYSEHDNFLEHGDEGAHIFEAGASVATGILSLTGFYNLFGNDDENSFYGLVSVAPPYSVEGMTFNVFAAGGNGIYDFTGEPGDSGPSFVVTELGLTVNKDKFFASYILNPDQETTYLVFGLHL